MPRGTQVSGQSAQPFTYGTLTLSGRPSQTIPLSLCTPSAGPCNPDSRSCRFGLLRFRSPLLAQSFLFLRVVRCFSSPGSLPLRGDPLFAGRVSPFGYRRFIACTRLADAFRSVPRPSSAPRARASPVRLLSLASRAETALPFKTAAISHQLSACRCARPLVYFLDALPCSVVKVHYQPFAYGR